MGGFILTMRERLTFSKKQKRDDVLENYTNMMRILHTLIDFLLIKIYRYVFWIFQRYLDRGARALSLTYHTQIGE